MCPLQAHKSLKRETIFERTERQAKERHEKEMQILQAKKILQANRPIFIPKHQKLDLPSDIVAYDPTGRGSDLNEKDIKMKMKDKGKGKKHGNNVAASAAGAKKRSPSPIRKKQGQPQAHDEYSIL